MLRYDTAGPVDVVVEVSVGHVEIAAGGRDGEVVVDVLPTVAGRSGDTALAESAEISFDDGHLRVRLPRRRNLLGKEDSADVRVRVPSGSTAEVTSAYGSVVTRGALGTTRIGATYGRVSVETTGDLTVDSRHGTVEVALVRGRLDVVAGHGHVRVEHVDGDAVLRGSHGALELGTVGGSLEVATSGMLTVDRALGDVTARSAHGAIRVREVTGGTVVLENAHAAVEVGVPAGVAAWVDASSAHGTVRNELTPDPTAAASERTVELHLRVDHADVVVRRAPGRTTTGTATSSATGVTAS